MALGVFAAGPYSAVATSPGVSPGSIGLLQDGWTLEWTILEQLLDKSDAYGRTLIETFHQGLRVAISAIFHEWKAQELRMVTPQMLAAVANYLPVGATNMDAGVMGAQGSDQASSLVLTALAGTPAATVGPASATFSKVKQQGDSPIGVLFGPEHRQIPFRGHVLPYTRSNAQGGISFWSAT